MKGIVLVSSHCLNEQFNLSFGCVEYVSAIGTCTNLWNRTPLCRWCEKKNIIIANTIWGKMKNRHTKNRVFYARNTISTCIPFYSLFKYLTESWFSVIQKCAHNSHFTITLDTFYNCSNNDGYRHLTHTNSQYLTPLSCRGQYINFILSHHIFPSTFLSFIFIWLLLDKLLIFPVQWVTLSS